MLILFGCEDWTQGDEYYIQNFVCAHHRMQCVLRYNNEEQSFISVRIRDRTAHTHQVLYSICRHPHHSKANRLDEMEYCEELHRVIRIADINFDSYPDVLLQEFWGVTGNRDYVAFVYDRRSHLFIKRNFPNGLCNPIIQIKDRTITTSSNGGGSNCSGDKYVWVGGRPVIASSWQLMTNHAGKFVERDVDYLHHPPITTEKPVEMH